MLFSRMFASKKRSEDCLEEVSLDAAARMRRAARALLAFVVVACVSVGVIGCSMSSDDASESTTESTAEGAAVQNESEGAVAEAAAVVSVDMVVDISAVEDGGVLFSETLELAQGATALDALEASGLDFSAEKSSYGAFVSNIEGVANGDHGSMSGWTYMHNGEMVMESCDALVLSSGDTVAWVYSTGEEWA